MHISNFQNLDISIEQAIDIAKSHYGIHVSAKKLDGEVDFNFYLKTNDGHEYTLKVSRPEAVEANLDFQVQLLEYLKDQDLPYNIPELIPTLKGKLYQEINEGSLQGRWVRMQKWVSGNMLDEVNPRSTDILLQWGRLAGRLSAALEGFDHEGGHRFYKWNPSETLYSKKFLPYITKEEEKEIAEYFWDMFEHQTLLKLKNMRQSINYNDAHEHNLLVNNDSADPGIQGIIDFGDALYTHTINELAIACAYACMYYPDQLQADSHLIKSYNEEFKIQAEELEVLYSLISARLMITVANAAWNKHIEPENEYLLISEKPAWDLLKKWRKIDPRLALYTFRAACDLPPLPSEERYQEWSNDSTVEPSTIIDTKGMKTIEIDLSIDSVDLGNHARYETKEVLMRTIRRHLEDGEAQIGIGGYGQYSPLNTFESFKGIGNDGVRWKTFNLTTHLWSLDTLIIRSPWAGKVCSIQNVEGGLSILTIRHQIDDDHGFYTRYIGVNTTSELKEEDSVEKGQHIAAALVDGSNERLAAFQFQVILDLCGMALDFPTSSYPEEEKLWLGLCPSPKPFLSGIIKQREDKQNSISEILSIRKKNLGKSLSISYDQPLHMVRGQGQYLIDTTGRKYLDTVNNVAHVGHEHPRVVRAGQRQSGLLNTNTRYLHDNIVEFARELLDTFPPELSVVHFVNSGSEANELAMRMVKANTGQRDMLAIEVGYHGNTGGCIDISSYKFDGKGGSGAPKHTHILPIPDSYRGMYKGDHTGSQYASHALPLIEGIKNTGRNIGGFIAESILSCGGQIMLPKGYLQEIYAMVRAEGGLCIADEVQVGFGRSGAKFWAFELQDVIPDIVTVGKPIGNGHPLAAVITTQKVAERFANGMEYFNTFGGNPVSCAIGREVLRVIQDEGLQQNALDVGNYLLKKLRELQQRHTIIGDVRGSGFFLGFELVKSRETLEPAPAEASYLANRMRQRGILMSTDGPLHNVLKIKPPMCFDYNNADFLIENIDMVLSENFIKRNLK